MQIQVSPHTASWKETKELAFPSKSGNEKVCMPACDWVNGQFKIMWKRLCLGYYMNPERGETIQPRQSSTRFPHSATCAIAHTGHCHYPLIQSHLLHRALCNQSVSSLQEHKEDPFMQCYCYIWREYFPLYFINKTNKQIKEQTSKRHQEKKESLSSFTLSPERPSKHPPQKPLQKGSQMSKPWPTLCPAATKSPDHSSLPQKGHWQWVHS